MTIGERIKQRRLDLKITQDELAGKISTSKQAVSKYENGIVTNIPIDRLTQIATALETTVAELTGMNDLAKELNTESLTTINHYLSNHSTNNRPNSYHSTSGTNIDFINKYNKLDLHGKKIVELVIEEEYDRCIRIKRQINVPTRYVRHSIYKVSAGAGLSLGDDTWEEISIPDTAETRFADFALTISGDSMEPIYHDGDIILVRECLSINDGEVGIFIVNGDGYIKKYGGDRLISLNEKYKDIRFHSYDDIRCVGKVIGRV